MADFYCDISALGNEYQAYAATPTWGALSTDRPLPMDGNGSAGPGHTAAVAIAELQITTNPADGNTLSIGGSAALTAKTSAAAKNQFTIGATAADSATALVSLINTYGTGTAQCDVTVNAAVSAIALAVPYFYFARIKPGATDTIQLVTRIAGADLNTASNSTSKITQVGGWLNSGAASVDFSEGQNGPFAYVFNTSTVFGKIDPQNTGGLTGYGLFWSSSPGPKEPNATTDIVHVRTARSGVNLSVSLYQIYNSGQPFATWKTRSYLFDDGTVWTGNNGTFKFNLRISTQTLQITALDGLHFESRSAYNFELIFNLTTNSAIGLHIFTATAAASVGFIRCKVTENASNYGNMLFRLFYSSITGTITGCRFDFSDSYMQVRGTVRGHLLWTNPYSGTTGCRIICYGSIYEVLGATGAIAAFMSSGSGIHTTYEWVGGAIRDSNGVYKCASPVTGLTSSDTVIFDSVVGVSDPSATFSTASSGSPASLRWIDYEGSPKAFRFLNHRFSVDWKNDGTFPYRAGAADLGGTPWSHRVLWTTQVNAAGSTEVLRLSIQHRDTAAVKTITLPLYVPDSDTYYKSEIEMLVLYIDSDNVRRQARSGQPAILIRGSEKQAIASSSAWVSNGLGAHSAKELSHTTAYAVKSNSEIVCALILKGYRAGTSTFYASPQLELT